MGKKPGNAPRAPLSSTPRKRSEKRRIEPRIKEFPSVTSVKSVVNLLIRNAVFSKKLLFSAAIFPNTDFLELPRMAFFSKALARLSATQVQREASWTAPVLWRFRCTNTGMRTSRKPPLP
jgi:hypothetical protein